MTSLKVIIAAHKPYAMPADPIYLPLQVGATGKPGLGIQRDDEGENLSSKNAHYCELTGLYWAWKNLDVDFLGLVHYRRYFAQGRWKRDKRQRIADEAFLRKHLTKSGVILPKPRRYWIETTWNQYAHAHHEADLHASRAVLEALCPEYLPAFDHVMRKTNGHRFNMFVMERSLLDAYCEWLFVLLSHVEQNLDISDYSPQDARVFGYLGERLLDVWIDHNLIPYVEVPVINLESQHWPRKAAGFLLRTIRRGK